MSPYCRHARDIWLLCPNTSGRSWERKITSEKCHAFLSLRTHARHDGFLQPAFNSANGKLVEHVSSSFLLGKFQLQARIIISVAFTKSFRNTGAETQQWRYLLLFTGKQYLTCSTFKMHLPLDLQNRFTGPCWAMVYRSSGLQRWHGRRKIFILLASSPFTTEVTWRKWLETFCSVSSSGFKLEKTMLITFLTAMIAFESSSFGMSRKFLS